LSAAPVSGILIGADNGRFKPVLLLIIHSQKATAVANHLKLQHGRRPAQIDHVYLFCAQQVGDGGVEAERPFVRREQQSQIYVVDRSIILDQGPKR